MLRMLSYLNDTYTYRIILNIMAESTNISRRRLHDKPAGFSFFSSLFSSELLAPHDSFRGMIAGYSVRTGGDS